MKMTRLQKEYPPEAFDLNNDILELMKHPGFIELSEGQTGPEGAPITQKIHKLQ